MGAHIACAARHARTCCVQRHPLGAWARVVKTCVEREPSFLSISSLTFLAEAAGPTEAQRALTENTPPAAGWNVCCARAATAAEALTCLAKTAADLRTHAAVNARRRRSGAPRASRAGPRYFAARARVGRGGPLCACRWAPDARARARRFTLQAWLSFPGLLHAPPAPCVSGIARARVALLDRWL